MYNLEAKFKKIVTVLRLQTSASSELELGSFLRCCVPYSAGPSHPNPTCAEGYQSMLASQCSGLKLNWHTTAHLWPSDQPAHNGSSPEAQNFLAAQMRFHF